MTLLEKNFTHMKKTITLLLVTMAGIAGAATTYTSAVAEEMSSFNVSVELILTDSPWDICSEQGLDEITLFEMGSELTGKAAADSFSAVYRDGSITFSWSIDNGNSYSSGTVETEDIVANATGEYIIGIMFGGNPLFQNLMIMVTTQEGSTSWMGMYEFSEGKTLSSITTEVDSGYIKSVNLNGASASASASVPEPTTATLSLLALAGLAARRRR